jgi:hypothetical protein
MTAIYDIASCSFVEDNRRFKDAYSILIKKAVSISETSVSCHETTRRSIVDGCHFRLRSRENLKYQL